jgi:hypothetical protein
LQQSNIWTDEGHPNAQYSFALCFENGKGIAANRKEAFRYYKLAAGQVLSMPKIELKGLPHNIFVESDVHKF